MSHANATTRDAMMEARRMSLHDTDKTEGFQPGSYGCHEALHTTSMILGMVHENLTMHPSIQMNPEWRNKVGEVEDILAELYQEIGSVHL